MKIKPTVIILFASLFFWQGATKRNSGFIMTVNGSVPADKMGICLTHEHVLVDFTGADSIRFSKYDTSAVFGKALPFLKEIYKLGCRSFVECTPEYLGRNPRLLKQLSDSSGLNIITNTGFYGAANNKYIPGFAFDKTPEQLAQIWISEWEQGIGNTGIKPGFIKIGVDSGPLSGFHKKLIIAAAYTHLKTGLTIASHTGPAVPAFEQFEILEKHGVALEAFIWVHAQAEKDISKLVAGAEKGAWISLDGLNEHNVAEFLSIIKSLREKKLLHKVLLSQDAGWYDPLKKGGGEYRGYTTLFEKLIPAFKKERFSEQEIKQLLVINPSKAFAIKVRKRA